MSNFWKIITAGLIAIVLTVLIGLYVLTEPAREVAKNPFMKSMSQQTNQWDFRVDLTPKPLKIGMPYAVVQSQLESAEFSIKDKKNNPRLRTPKGSNDENLGSTDEMVYSLRHWNYACDKEYVVFLKFDKSKHLTSAHGMMRVLGCL